MGKANQQNAKPSKRRHKNQGPTYSYIQDSHKNTKTVGLNTCTKNPVPTCVSPVFAVSVSVSS